MRRLFLPITLLLVAGLVYVLSSVLSSRDGANTAGPASPVELEAGAAQNPSSVRLRGAAADASSSKTPSRPGSTLEGLVLCAGEGQVSTLRLYRYARLNEGLGLWSSLDGLGTPLRELTSGADGAFKFSGLPTGLFVLDARAPDGSRGSIRSIQTRGQHCWEVLRLRRGAQALVGRAVHTDGRPWRGLVAVSIARDRASARARPDFISTDSNGAFAFEKLPSGRVNLVAWRPEESRYRGPGIDLPTEGAYTFVVPSSPSQLDGLVLDAKTSMPIAGAHVLCRSHLGEGEGLTTRAGTDHEGRFQAGRLQGATSVTVSADGYAQATARPPSGLESVQFRLQRTASISGVALSAEDRRPVGGVLIHAHREGDSKAYLTTSGAGGRFRFVSLPPGRWAVVAMGGAWQSATLVETWWSHHYKTLAAGDSLELELLLARAARAEGRVLDVHGQPVAGAWVWVDPEGFSRLLEDIRAPWVMTDLEGCFALETLLPGIDNRLRARRAGTADGWTDDFRPTSQQVTRIDVVLPPERWICATVVSLEGAEPIPGARVEASRYREYIDRRSASGRTDESGTVRVGPLPAGAIEVEVSADGFVGVKQVVPEEAIGQIRRKFTLLSGSTIAGRCVFPDGTPAPDMHVWATGPGAGGLDVTGSDGAFSLENLSSGDWRISIEPSSWASSNWTAKHVATVRAGARGLELTVDAGLTRPIRIKVTDPDGLPVPGYDAVGRGRYRCQWSSDGVVRIPTGHRVRWLEIRDIRTFTGEVLPLAPVIIGPLDNGCTEVTVKLEHGHSIRGRVVDATGHGVQGVEIYAWPEAKRPDNRYAEEHAVAATDNEGAYVLIGLWAGEYRLRVTRKEPYADTLDVVAEAGAENVLIKIKSALKAQVRVVDPEGRPVHDAEVWVRRPGGPFFKNAHTDRAGGLTLEGLDASAEYRIAVDPPDSRPELGERTFPAWQPGGGELALPSALAIRGRVMDPRGRAAESIYVSVWRQGAEGWDYVSATTADGNGHFVVGHLAPGAYRLRATQSRPEAGPLVASSLAQAGASHVELTLRPGTPLTLAFENAPASIVGTEVTITPQSSGPDRRKATVAADVTARFEAEPAATYTFYRWDSDAGLVAFQTGIRAGLRGEAKRVAIRFEPAKSLRVRVLRPEGVSSPTVSLTLGALTRSAEKVSADTFEFRGLPAGAYAISVTAQARSSKLQAEATGRAGESIEVTLR